MIDYKLKSVDRHMSEHPDCYKRIQKQYGARAPRAVATPEGIGKGLYLLMEGLEPMHIG